MTSTPNSLFRHYLDSLIQRGTTRASLTEEARDVLRTWYLTAKKGCLLYTSPSPRDA